MKPSAEKMVEMYRIMQTIRLFELKGKEIKLNKERVVITGNLHLYIGQEAVAVGMCMALEEGDGITSTHRGHGHCIAKGADLRGMMAELLGREGGYCKGRGGSMHITDFSKGILGANGIVAGGVPIAMGAALGFQVLGRKNVAVTFFGDGAINQGSFHESAIFAAIWKLPVIFFCENNLYASVTPARITHPHPDISIRAAAYNMPGVSVDGQDVLAVYEVACQAAKRARDGEGPTLIEAKTYRYEGHWLGGPEGDRPDGELDRWKARDPLVLFRKVLMDKGILDEKREREIIKKVEAEVAEAEKFAFASPEPDPATAMNYIYKED
jgi:TPP-dependent pyruvate/acetoin dehydrogenase alpha subunit